MEDGQFVDKATAWAKLAEKNAEIERLRNALDRAADALEFYDNKAEAQKARAALAQQTK